MAEPTNPARRRTGATRALLTIALLLLAAYAANIGLSIADVKLHARAWRLGDVGEFVLVLFAMAFFVAGLMFDEQAPAASGDETAGPLSSQGGER